MSRHWGWFWARAWALLLFAALCWAGNSVAARLAIGEVSPMTLVFARWLVIGGVLAIAIPGQVRAHLPTLWAHRWYVLGLAGLGLTGFNALLYLAAHSTTAINIVLLQSCVPALVLVGALARGDKITGMQFLGIAITLLGVIVVATHGDLSRLRDLSFNRGDLLMMTGCLGGAWYNLSLRKRPPIPAIVFFAGLSLGAALASAPLLMIEAARGEAFWPS